MRVTEQRRGHPDRSNAGAARVAPDDERNRFHQIVGPSLAREVVTFTATDTYTYPHRWGAEPDVKVLSSGGKEIRVCVVHTDTETVTLKFDGTLTDANLLLT